MQGGWRAPGVSRLALAAIILPGGGTCKQKTGAKMGRRGRARGG
jgi:hypothetical protein